MMYQCSDRVNNFVRISCDIKIVAIVRTPLVLETLSILKVNRLPSRKCAPYTFPDRRHSSPKIRRKEQEVKTMVVIWEICIVDIPFIVNIAKTVQNHSLSVMSLSNIFWQGAPFDRGRYPPSFLGYLSHQDSGNIAHC